MGKTPPDQAEINAASPGKAEWRAAEAEARHVFTHFSLSLKVMVARGPALPGRYLDYEEARAAAPTVFRKAMEIALASL